MDEYLYIFNKQPTKQKIKFWWLKLFTPNYYLRSFHDLTISILQQNQIKILVCDIDNTLVPYYKTYPDKEAIQFISKVESNGIKVILMSNNTAGRVRKIAKKLGVQDYYGLSFKPSVKNLRTIMKKYDVRKNQIMVFGDQLLTDILMANLFRCSSILTLPLLSPSRKRNTLFLLIEKFIYLKLTDQHILPRNIYSEQKTDIKQSNLHFDWF